MARTDETRRTPVAFFGLTALLAAPFLVLGALVQVPGGLVGGLPLSALQVTSPFLAAVILMSRQQGWRGVPPLLRDAGDVRRVLRARHLIPVVLIMPIIYSASYVLMLLGGRNLPPWGMSLSSIVALLALFLLSGILEEVGWTGYALEPLAARIGYVGAALVIGVVCALFHIPADVQAGHEMEWIIWQRLGSIALRVIIVGAYIYTGRALAAAVIVHAMENIGWSTFPSNGSYYDPSVTTPAGLAVAGLGLLGYRALSGSRSQSEGPVKR